MGRISAIRKSRELEPGISLALRAGLRILYVGPGDGTCLQRAGALRRLGHTVHHVVSGCPKGRFDRQLWRVANRLGLVLSYAATPPDLNGANRSILRSLRAS